jgi:hypothetical protein
MIEDYEELDEPGVEESAPVEERPTRGLLWVLMPLLLGVSLGTMVGVVWKPHRPFADAPLSEGLIGAGIGLVLGVLIWVCFPYKKS